MKKYTIHFHGVKYITKQGQTFSKKVEPDEDEETIQSDDRPAIWHLTNFAYLRYGFPGACFHSDPDVPGLFHAYEVRDLQDRPNSRGKFLVHVEVQITMSLNLPSSAIGTLGCSPKPTTGSKAKSTTKSDEDYNAFRGAGLFPR
jgi:hypothetical protein